MIRTQFPAEGLCIAGDGADLGWLELLPGVTENGPSLHDWPEIGLAQTLNSEGSSAKSVGHRRFFELVSSRIWHVKQSHSGAETATEAYSLDFDGASGQLRTKITTEPNSARQHGVSGWPKRHEASNGSRIRHSPSHVAACPGFPCSRLAIPPSVGSQDAPDWPSAGRMVSGVASGLTVVCPLAD